MLLFNKPNFIRREDRTALRAADAETKVHAER